jgi:hypothetical protein
VITVMDPTAFLVRPLRRASEAIPAAHTTATDTITKNAVNSFTWRPGWTGRHARDRSCFDGLTRDAKAHMFFGALAHFFWA